MEGQGTEGDESRGGVDRGMEREDRVNGSGEEEKRGNGKVRDSVLKEEGI